MPRIGHRPMYGFMPMLGAKQIEASWTANAVHFDGTNDYYTLAGGLNVTPSKAGSIVVRFNYDDIGTDMNIFGAASGRFTLNVEPDVDRISIVVDQNDLGGTGMRVLSATSSVAANTWYTVMISWDGAVGVSASRCQINGVDKYSSTSELALDETYRYTGDNLGVGASSTGGSKFDGCIEAIAFSTTYVDWDTKANRDAVHDDTTFELLDPGTNGTNWFGAGDANMLWVGPHTAYVNSGSGGDSFTEQSAPDACAK